MNARARTLAPHDMALWPCMHAWAAPVVSRMSVCNNVLACVWCLMLLFLQVSTHKSTRGWKISAVWDNLTSSLKRQSSGHSTGKARAIDAQWLRDVKPHYPCFECVFNGVYFPALFACADVSALSADKPATKDVSKPCIRR